jgi:hypothetical protein
VYQPPLTTTAAGQRNVTFVAFSAFMYVVQYLGLPTGWGTAVSVSEIVAAPAALCAMPWAKVVNRTAPSTLPFVAGYCVMGAYVASLLRVPYVADALAW